MKKNLSLLLLVAAFAFTASAQKKSDGGLKFNIAAEAAVPVGNASDSYSFGIGGSAKLEAPITTGLNFTASAGYTSMMYTSQVKAILKAFGSSDTQAGFVPLKVGIKYFLADQFYGAAEFGAAIGTKSGMGTAFAYSPGIGYVIPLDGGNGIDIGARYEGWSKDGTLGFIGFHVAYKFGL